MLTYLQGDLSTYRTPINMNVIRRLGPDPHADGRKTIGLNGCPDILELDSGDFIVIGETVTQSARSALPSSASCGPDESIIRIPRNTLVLAKPDIPDL